MRLTCLVSLGLFLVATEARAEIVAETSSYTDGETAMQGYLAYDKGLSGKRPGVLVVHEWGGQDAYAQDRARRLAELGYVALAVDMYGGGKVMHQPKAGMRLMKAIFKDKGVAKKRFMAAMTKLQAHPLVDEKRIAAVGYCYGGAIVLDMARTGVPLRGVASFNATLTSGKKAQPKQVKARMIVFNGAADPLVDENQLSAFSSEMFRAKAKMELFNFAGAKHAFSNPRATAYGMRFKLPLAYDLRADQRSWRMLTRFLQQVF